MAACSPADRGTPPCQPSTTRSSTSSPRRDCGTGLDFGYLSVRPDAVVRAKPDVPRLRELASLGVAGGLSVSAWDGTTAHTRVFAGAVGVPEDPATGSSALGY